MRTDRAWRYAASGTETRATSGGTHVGGGSGWNGRRSTSFRRGPEREDQPTHLRHRRRDRDDDDCLQHVHHLLRDERVDREAALRQRREEHGRDDDTERMASAHERDGDSEKAGAGAEALFIVALVTKHVV